MSSNPSSPSSQRIIKSPSEDDWEELDIIPGSFVEESIASPPPATTNEPQSEEYNENEISTDDSVSIEEESGDGTIVTPATNEDSTHRDTSLVSQTIFDSSSPHSATTADNLQSKLDASDFVQDKMVSSTDSITVSIDSREDMAEKISSSFQRGKEETSGATFEAEQSAIGEDTASTITDKSQRTQSQHDQARSETDSTQPQENDYDSRNVTVDSNSLLDLNEDELMGEDFSTGAFDTQSVNTFDDASSMQADFSDDNSRRQIADMVQNALEHTEVQDFVKERIEKAMANVAAEVAAQEVLERENVALQETAPPAEKSTPAAPPAAQRTTTNSTATVSSPPSVQQPYTPQELRRRISAVEEANVSRPAAAITPPSSPPQQPSREVDRTSTHATTRRQIQQVAPAPRDNLAQENPILTLLDSLFNPNSPSFNLFANTILVFISYVVITLIWSGTSSAGGAGSGSTS